MNVILLEILCLLEWSVKGSPSCHRESVFVKMKKREILHYCSYADCLGEICEHLAKDQWFV